MVTAAPTGSTGLAHHFGAIPGSCNSMLAVHGIVILHAIDGSRLLSKYYGNGDLAQSIAVQKAFEKTLFERTKKFPNQEVTTCNGRVVVYRSNLDVLIYLVGCDQTESPNELSLAIPLDCLYQVLTTTIKPQLDRTGILESYDTVSLIIDEIVDHGVVLECNPNDVVEKMARTSTFGNVSSVSVDSTNTSEQTLSGALSFATQKLRSFLR